MSPAHSTIARYGNSRRFSTASACEVSSSCACQTLLGGDDLHDFDLLELMLPDHPARIASIAARLAAETRRMADVANRQAFGIENLIAIEIRDRHFGRGNQIQIVIAGDAELIFGKFRQLSRSEQRIAVDEVRNVHLGIAVLGDVQIEHELRQRALQARKRTANDDEPRAADARSGFEIERSVRAEIDVILRRKIQLRRLTPRAQLDVRRFVLRRPARSHPV